MVPTTKLSCRAGPAARPPGRPPGRRLGPDGPMGPHGPMKVHGSIFSAGSRRIRRSFSGISIYSNPRDRTGRRGLRRRPRCGRENIRIYVNGAGMSLLGQHISKSVTWPLQQTSANFSQLLPTPGNFCHLKSNPASTCQLLKTPAKFCQLT